MKKKISEPPDWENPSVRSRFFPDRTGTVGRLPTYNVIFVEQTPRRQACFANAQEVTDVPGLFTAIALFIKELMLLVSYVKNNAFPQPLTEEEEMRHLKQMAQGDQHSRNMLIEHNLRLVAHIVNTL